jgi:hypothetical protein
LCDGLSSTDVSSQAYDDGIQGDCIMIPLVVSGVFIAGLLWLRKLGEPSDTWADRKEQQNFRKERENWVDETVFWNLRR